MVRSDGVPQKLEGAGAPDVGGRAWDAREVFKKRRGLDICGFLLPGIPVAGRHRKSRPSLVPLEYVRILAEKHLGLYARADRFLDLLRRGPDILEVDVVPRGVFSEGVILDVDIHRPGDCIRHHKRRGCKVICFDERVDPPFEVPVSREDRDGDEIVLLYRRSDRLRERAAVSDAGCASVTYEVETQIVKRRA